MEEREREREREREEERKRADKRLRPLTHLVGIEEFVYGLHRFQEFLLHELQLNQNKLGNLAG